MWVRFIGEGTFYLLPVEAIVWRYWSDRQALKRVLGPEAIHWPRAPTVTPDEASAAPARERNLRFVRRVVAPLIVVWAAFLSLKGPASWSGQSLWLLFWLGFVELVYRAIWKRTPEGAAAYRAAGQTRWQRVTSTLATIGGAWPLAMAGTVVRVGLQWIFAALWFGPFNIKLEFFGWVLGQATPSGAHLPALILGSALLFDAIWAVWLMRQGAAPWQPRNSWWARSLRLGAVQAASASFMLATYITVLYLSKTEAAPGIGYFDVWHMWTQATRAALGASFVGEVIPLWLPIIGVVVGWFLMAFGSPALRLRREQERWRTHVEPTWWIPSADGVVAASQPPMPHPLIGATRTARRYNELWSPRRIATEVEGLYGDPLKRERAYRLIAAARDGWRRQLAQTINRSSELDRVLVDNAEAEAKFIWGLAMPVAYLAHTLGEAEELGTLLASELDVKPAKRSFLGLPVGARWYRADLARVRALVEARDRDSLRRRIAVVLSLEEASRVIWGLVDQGDFELAVADVPGRTTIHLNIPKERRELFTRIATGEWQLVLEDGVAKVIVTSGAKPGEPPRSLGAASRWLSREEAA